MAAEERLRVHRAPGRPARERLRVVGDTAGTPAPGRQERGVPRQPDTRAEHRGLRAGRGRALPRRRSRGAPHAPSGWGECGRARLSRHRPPHSRRGAPGAAGGPQLRRVGAAAGDTPAGYAPARRTVRSGGQHSRVLRAQRCHRRAGRGHRAGRLAKRPRRIGKWTIYGAVVGLLFGAAAFSMVWLYGRRLLITPLRFIAAEMEAMHVRGELSEVASAPPSEEWALFLSTFNETVRSLRDSELRYGALFDRAADPYFLLDAGTGLVVDANPAAAALVGEPRERLVGAPLPLILRAQPENGNAIRVRRPDGTVQTWGVVETIVTLGERRLQLAAYRDLTDREALAQSQKMDAIGSLAGGIAHDFNNLMGSVLAGVRVARGALPSDARGAAALDAIEHAGRRAAELTRQLVGVTRHEPLLRVPVDVRGAIANIERMCASTFDRRIRIVVDVPPRLPAVEGDPGQVEQALLNLCINARDAMPEGGVLRLAARVEALEAEAALRIRDIQAGVYVVLSVSDDGVGMNDDVKKRIFEPFFTTKHSGEGTGLGLAMVYGFVRSAGGTIVVDSAPASGARFDLYLPASGAHVVAPSAPDEPSVQPVQDQARAERPWILLADDEAGLREMLRMVLEQEGYEVLEASNGDEAIALVEAHLERLAAVLLDVQMPVLGGIEAHARIRAIAPQLPVILGTGYVGSAELAALRDIGADDLITKPYEMRDLLERLARLTAVRT